ncbi:MAG TPA: PPC domain-containing DNA-binding protein [Casimicrobiaceae bacterium]|nr:PPC domain-containing DNA-binding protein [Casimicrobiaceae bacterium]
MRAKVLDEVGERTWALVFDAGDEVVSALSRFASLHQLTAARFTAIGAFSEATLGYFDPESKAYEKIPVREQVEVLSLIGDVALDAGQPKIHAHVVVGKRDGSAHGGHLIEARVRPTLEVMLVESPARLARIFDPDSGLALIAIDRSQVD